MFLSGSGISVLTFLTPVFSLLIYTDPGYGTLIWQLLLGGFFGGMFYFRRLRDFVARRKRPDNGEQ